MPYNFETTFTQPILTKLDNGVIKGPKDWANTITNAYINTIKLGLPQAVPSVLPAPGLNPSAPPPFAIGASPYTTASARSKQMYNVIYAYFYAKELKLDQGSIQGMVASVKQLITKLKTRQRQVKTLIDQINIAKEEVKQIPKLIEEIIEGIQDEIKYQAEKIEDVARSLQRFRIELGPVRFDGIFAEELDLINKVKKFKVTDPVAVRDMVLLVSDYGKRTNNLLASTSSEALMKNYVKTKLVGVASLYLDLAKGVVDPTKILDIVKQLANARAKAKLLQAKVERFDLFVRYIQPKLTKLERRKKQKIREIKTRIQTKLVDLKKRLNKKIEEYNKKKEDGKAKAFYKKAKKTITDFKKKNEVKIKKARKTVRLLKKAFKQSAIVVGKTIALSDGLRLEFENIKSEIIKFQKSTKESVENFNSSINNAPTTQTINVKSTDVNFINNEVEKVKKYFQDSGLSDFANLAALIITETKCSVQTFKIFFQKQNSRIKQYVSEFEDLEISVKDLVKTLKELRSEREEKSQDGENQRSNKTLISRIKSLKDLLLVLLKKVKPTIQRIQTWIKIKIKQAKTYIETKLKKFKEDLEVYILNLLPIKSDVQDPKDKKLAAQDKKNKIKNRVKQVKSIAKSIKHAIRMGRSAITITKNINSGKYTFSQNSQPIDDLLNSYFAFRMEGKSRGVQSQLLEEKIIYKQRFQSLLIIELLITSLIETFKEIKQTNFTKDFEQLMEVAKTSIPGRSTITNLIELFKNPPRDPKQLKDAVESLSLDVLQDVHVITKLVELEKKYLRKSREVIKTACDIKELEGSKFGSTLLKIKNCLQKNQSFIQLGIDLLKKEFQKLIAFIKKKVSEIIKNIKNKIKEKKAKQQQNIKKEVKNEKDRKVNADAAIMSVVFGLATRLFWTGAQWIGPTGSNHLVITIGSFKRIKAKSTDGASAMVREIARSFERQLYNMRGFVTPIAATGIPPISFTGYK